MIDRQELLATLRPLVPELEESIRERALSTPNVAEHLEREHHKAIVAERTAMSLEEWRDGEITQAAVAWVLGCVFVRFLEDNGLIDQALISGPGGRRAAALGHREEHFRAHPDHSDREYLETAFADASRFTAVAPLYDQRHNPLWRLGPTADGARVLRETFTAIDPVTGKLAHDFNDPELRTRFLGDLYQDLSETAKKRYALLQTPEFVEQFILDRTLAPAIEEFGLDEVRLIDPTCGSGHFLISAFERTFALWLDREPGTERAVLAQRCLDRIAGVDLNPFAAAIARFRLLITALRACGVRRLAEAPAFKIQIAAGDSLLHGPKELRGMAHTQNGVQHAYDSEDLADLEHILGRGYHAVVGNPPYIAVQDSALRDAYRARYASCHGRYVLTVPFMERFFELARPEAPGERGVLAGYVGKITGNNFMKREFGAPLVERFLRSVDVQTVIDGSGAYIPGHGTPTILIFGRSRAPMASRLRVVDGIRGEPGQPADAADGLVWSSITSLVDRPGEEDNFTRSSDIDRGELLIHPMTLGIGRELRKRLDATKVTIGDKSRAVGITAVNGEDDVYTAPAVQDLRRHGVERTIELVTGDLVRDWTDEAIGAVWTMNDAFEVVEPRPGSGDAKRLWLAKPVIRHRRRFGTPMVDRGLSWFEWQEVYAGKLRTPLSITWGEVATHNHFALDRGGKVFKQTAPVIKLPEGSTEAQHLALLSVLNSSVACFWLKQVCQPKGGDYVGQEGARVTKNPWEDRYALNASNIADLPLPPRRSPDLAAAIDALATSRSSLLDPSSVASGDEPLAQRVEGLQTQDQQLTARMISLQEELDWQVLTAFGLAPEELPMLGEQAPPIQLGERAFEIVLARQVAGGQIESNWFERHGSAAITEVPTRWPPAYRAVVEQRVAIIESDPDVGLVERAENKRRWSRRPWLDRQREALRRLVLDALDGREMWAELRPRSTAELTDILRPRPELVEALELLSDRKDADLAATLRRLVLDAAVPHVAAQRLTEKGLRKRAEWELVWELQRAEDRGEDVGSIAVPPRYAQADFRAGTYWKYRGKLDIPTERFLLIPNAERGADSSPVVGWSGWDERELARAFAGRVMELREQEAADAVRVIPLLASIMELLPWIHHWYPESDPLYGGPPGAYFEGWLDSQLAELAMTRNTLTAWRPPSPTRGRKAKAGAA